MRLLVSLIKKIIMQEETPIYTTPEAVASYLGLPISSDLEDAIEESWIIAMSRYADRYAKRNLHREEVTTVLYDGDGSKLFLIKDVIDPVVEIDGTVMTTYNYPTNKPYTSRLTLEEGYSFTKGKQNISVTGVHAMHLYLPEDIQLAVTILVAGIYNARTSQGKIGTTEKIGNYSVTYRTDAQKADFESAKEILSSYRRIAL